MKLLRQDQPQDLTPPTPTPAVVTQNPPCPDQVNCRSLESENLGNTVCNNFQNDEEDLEFTVQYNARKSLRSLQNLLNKTRTKHTICFCMNSMFDTSQPTYMYNRTVISNLTRCKIPKCPSCAKKIYSDKAKEIEQIVDYSVNTLDLDIFMITLTRSHSKRDSLEDLWDSLTSLKTKLFKHRDIQDHDPVWYHSTFEPNYNFRNGFHPHFHVLIAFKKGSLKPIHEQDIKNRYSMMAAKMGFNASNVNGLDIKRITNGKQISAYVTKFDHESQISKELASDNKSTKVITSVSMRALIQLYSDERFDELPFAIPEAAKVRCEKIILEYLKVKNKRTFQGCMNYKKILKTLKTRREELTGPVENNNKDTQVERISISPILVHRFIDSKRWHQILLIQTKYKDLKDVYNDIVYLLEKHYPSVDIDSELLYEVFDSPQDVPQRQLKWTPRWKYKLYNDFNKCAA